MEASKTIIIGSTAEPERETPMADPRDISLSGRKRLRVAFDADALADPKTLWRLAVAGGLRKGDAVDVEGESLLVVLRFDAVDEAAETATVTAIDEHYCLPVRSA